MAAEGFTDPAEYFKDVDVELHTTPGEFVYKGDVYPGFVPKSLFTDPFSVIQPRKDDIFVAAYPKSGQTWTIQMIWLIINCSGREDSSLKLETLAEAKSGDRFLEMDFQESLKINYDDTIEFLKKVVGENMVETLKSVPAAQLIEMTPSPRVIKTHMLQEYIMPLISKFGCKVVSVARNPKDACVSAYHHYLMCELLNRSLEHISWNTFFNTWVNKKMMGDWFQYVYDWWKLKDEPNVLFLKYEDMLEDHLESVKKIAEFLGYPLSEKAIDLVVKATSLSSMKKNKNVNIMQNKRDKSQTFIRKGVVGDWKNYFTVAQSEVFDALYAKKMEEAKIYFKHYNQ